MEKVSLFVHGNIIIKEGCLNEGLTMISNSFIESFDASEAIVIEGDLWMDSFNGKALRPHAVVVATGDITIDPLTPKMQYGNKFNQTINLNRHEK